MRLSPSFCLLSLLAAAGSLLACGDGGAAGSTPEPGPQPPNVLTADVQVRDDSPEVDGRDLTSLVDSNTAFALDAFALLAAEAPGENVALGPYSISQAMAMLYAGARTHTASELEGALRFEIPAERLHPTFNGLGLELLSRNGDVTLRIANRVWTDTSFEPEPEFLDVLARDYGAPLAVADFAADPEMARRVINGWVHEVTEEKIKELFPIGTIDATTKLVLANAMYLDAPWKYQFDPDRTSKRGFTLLDGAEVEVDTMHYDEFLPSAWDEQWSAVELPYKGDERSMIVVVPEDLASFEASLSPQVLADVLAAIEDGGIHLSMPRFTFSFHSSLVELFKALGAPSLFDGADLSGLGAGGLAVSAIEHEAFIQVDEEGTKAAAATGVAVADSHGPTIQVNRPFLFFVVDRPTGSILFLGRVTDPRG